MTTRAARIFNCILIGLLISLLPRPVFAHAVLTSSDPADNVQLSVSPAQVRLVFTEAVEPAFSRVTLFDSMGMQASTDAAHVDPNDKHALILPLAPLPDGLYSARWSVVSADDGHGTQGTINFVVGTSTALPTEASSMGAMPMGAESMADEGIDPWGAGLRWFNLLALSLLVGVAAFAAGVLPPANRTAQQAKRINILIVAGWTGAGIALLDYLWLQSQLMLATTGERMSAAHLIRVLSNSRFGTIWTARSVLWFVAGLLALLAIRRGKGYIWIVLSGLALLLLQSAQSHAAATPIPVAAITSDWLHLTLSTFWIGGLVALVIVTPYQRSKWTLRAPLITGFSNYARLLVLGLVLTGSYAAWLQVGSWRALIDTSYGNALLLKLLLMIPLLAIAASNWLLTKRSQDAGRDLWQGRLRGFLVAELVILVAVLGAVGVMTSTMPARTMENMQLLAQARVDTQAEQTLLALQTEADDLHLHLVITRGYVGENNFALTVHDLAMHLPVVDVSLIRLRFLNEDAGGGESELRIEDGENGTYQATGANLNAPGNWRIRATVQRPDAFDVVADFETPVESAPPPAAPEVAEINTLTEVALYGVTSILAITLIGNWWLFVWTAQRPPTE